VKVSDIILRQESKLVAWKGLRGWEKNARGRTLLELESKGGKTMGAIQMGGGLEGVCLRIHLSRSSGTSLEGVSRAIENHLLA